MSSNNRSTTTITDILNALNSNVPNLDHNKSHLLKDLVGLAYWNSIPVGHRKQLGVKFKELAISDALPVSYAGSTTSNQALYQLK